MPYLVGETITITTTVSGSPTEVTATVLLLDGVATQEDFTTADEELTLAGTTLTMVYHIVAPGRYEVVFESTDDDDLPIPFGVARTTFDAEATNVTLQLAGGA